MTQKKMKMLNVSSGCIKTLGMLVLEYGHNPRPQILDCQTNDGNKTLETFLRISKTCAAGVLGR